MFIAKVIGNLWTTQKHPSLVSRKLLIIQLIDGITQEPNGEPMLAVDSEIDAGIDDIVLIMDEGNSARQILENKHAPVRTIIVGIIDQVKIGKKEDKVVLAKMRAWRKKRKVYFLKGRERNG